MRRFNIFLIFNVLTLHSFSILRQQEGKLCFHINPLFKKILRLDCFLFVCRPQRKWYRASKWETTGASSVWIKTMGTDNLQENGEKYLFNNCWKCKPWILLYANIGQLRPLLTIFPCLIFHCVIFSIKRWLIAFQVFSGSN